MTMRIVEEDVEAVSGVLRTYAVVVLLATMLIRFATGGFAFLENICLLLLAPFLVAYCHYHIASEDEYLRRRFRIYLSGITALGCAILSSHDGDIRVRSFDLSNGLIIGVVGGVVSHIIGLLARPIADLLLDRVRRFVDPQECRTCGYDLTGNTSGICPECGTSVPLHLRDRAVPTNE